MRTASDSALARAADLAFNIAFRIEEADSNSAASERADLTQIARLLTAKIPKNREPLGGDAALLAVRFRRAGGLFRCLGL